jgi:predicted NBD/HSP70 family sugar kinase
MAANDINLAALAEHRHGAGRDASHLLMVATGNRGVGGALVLDGALYTGSDGVGMEAGHVSVDPGGVLPVRQPRLPERRDRRGPFPGSRWLPAGAGGSWWH